MKGDRLSKVRTDPRVVDLKRSIHTRSCCKRKRKRDRPVNILGASKMRTDFAQSIGKNTTGRNNRPRLTASRIAKLSEDGPRFQPKFLRTGRYMPRLFIWKTQRLRSKPGPFFRNIPDTSIIALQTIFPKDSGYFDDSISRNIWHISGKRFPKYAEYFEKMVGGYDFPEISGIFREIGPYKK